ncbi:unnamed protein product, partial [Musa acuminata subsp. burmannicoides]
HNSTTVRLRCVPHHLRGRQGQKDHGASCLLPSLVKLLRLVGSSENQIKLRFLEVSTQVFVVGVEGR